MPACVGHQPEGRRTAAGRAPQAKKFARKRLFWPLLRGILLPLLLPLLLSLSLLLSLYFYFTFTFTLT